MTKRYFINQATLQRLILAMSFVFLSACSLSPDYQKPYVQFDKHWQIKPSEHITNYTVEANWWQSFNDDTLNQLVKQAIENNHDLLIATDNIQVAKWLRTTTRSEGLPSLNYNNQAERSRVSKEINEQAKSESLFSQSLDARWELDLFGRIKNKVLTEEANINAITQAKHHLQISIVAETAQNYFLIRGLQKRIAALKNNISLLRETEDIVNEQLKAGLVTELDLLRARGQRHDTASLLPKLEANLQIARYRLAVLTGQPPETHQALLENNKTLPKVPDLVPVGLRSDLLLRRPDVQQAEYQLKASNSKIGTAIAERYPRLSLTSALSTAARTLGAAFSGDAIAYSLSSLISWPLYQGGALRANIQIKELETEIAAKRYEQTVLLALEEADKALLRYAHEWRTMSHLKRSEKARRKARTIAKYQYEAGQESFIHLLDAERSLIDSQDKVIQSETQILLNLAQLYKALGGGWELSKQNTKNTDKRKIKKNS